MDEVELVSKSKYSKWIKREEEKGYKREDIIPTLAFFESNSSKFQERDIFKWDAKDLEDFIKDNNIQSNRKLREKDKENATKIFENDEWLIVHPNDVASCSFYGKGTKWCITMTTGNYFNSYRDQNYTFHIIIDKKAAAEAERNAAESNTECVQPEWAKVCCAIKRNTKNEPEKIEFYSALDKPHDIKELPDRLREFLSN